jgi:hypothetical protein
MDRIGQGAVSGLAQQNVNMLGHDDVTEDEGPEANSHVFEAEEK